ncbi:MAG: hypothetical protein Q8N23_13085 [Archangium sp.]|nr:hypothetical protein [Archangium sp.]MDP3153605.1 hypothetical protein [Archangium sp.]MDP3569327.1 hypothetical protein [Archangium sp.]
MKLTSVYRNDHIRVANAGPLLIVVYGDNVPPEAFKEIDRQQGLMVARYGKISVLSVVGGSKSMSRVRDDVKEAALELVKKYRHDLVASATVVPPNGFTSTIIRTFMVGFSLLAKNPYPTKVFSEVGLALTWIKQVPGQDAGFADAPEEVTEVQRFAA